MSVSYEVFASVELVFKYIGNVLVNSPAAHAGSCLFIYDLSAAKYDASEANSDVLQQRLLCGFIAAL